MTTSKSTTEQAIQLVRACRLHADFAINRYLMSNADGRESGAEKAQRHHELCEFYVDVFRGEDDEDQNWYWAAHTATQQLTDNLDTEIGFPLKGAPDYDKLAPLFFERFHALASAALATPPAAPADEFERGRQQGMQQERALWGLAASGQAIEAAQAEPHNDHPLRHFDRTCPACVAEQAEPPKPVAWMWDEAKYHEGDLRGRCWFPSIGRFLPGLPWMVRNVMPLYAEPVTAASEPEPLMSQIESPFNACMHREYCKGLKRAASEPAAPNQSLLRDMRLFLESVPRDLGRGSLNGMRAQLECKVYAALSTAKEMNL